MRKVVRFLLSAGLIIVMFLALQRLVTPKYVSDIVEGGFTAEYYRETTPHQVLMVGDCELYENFSPITLWEKYGITSYIRGSAQQLTWQSYYLLEDALKRETPDVVIFNVLELKYNEPQREEYNRMTLDGMKWSGTKLKAIKASMTEEEQFLDYLLPLLRYHSRITELTKEDFEYYFDDITRTTAGYYMRVDVDPYEEGIWEEDEPEDYELGAYAMEYMDKITNLCKEKGIELLLVKAPSVSPIWYPEWEEQIVAYAKEHDLQYINFLELVDEIGIDYSMDTYDEGLHMNLSGAEKCADYLGQYLVEHYGLEDMRSDALLKEEWEKKADFYYELRDKQYEELEEYGEIISY